jgi:four helix bundle protein
MAKGDDIQERLINFAVTIIELSSELPGNRAGNHISGQILRCGTSPAPNYGEARGAESKKDFVHKLKVVLKELNETTVWLLIIHRSNLLTEDYVMPILSECQELSRIIASSIKTTLKNM